MRSDVQKASAAARRTAASPPKNSMAKKMKVSEIEICPRTRGIATDTREPKASVTRLMSMKRRPRVEGWRPVTVNAQAAAPSEMTAHRYGCELRCLVVELNIGFVFVTDGMSECSNVPGAYEGGGQRPAGARYKCKWYSSDREVPGREMSAENADFSLHPGVRGKVRSVRLTRACQDDKKPLTRPAKGRPDEWFQVGAVRERFDSNFSCLSSLLFPLVPDTSAGGL